MITSTILRIVSRKVLLPFAVTRKVLLPFAMQSYELYNCNLAMHEMPLPEHIRYTFIIIAVIMCIIRVSLEKGLMKLKTEKNLKKLRTIDLIMAIAGIIINVFEYFTLNAAKPHDLEFWSIALLIVLVLVIYEIVLWILDDIELNV